MRHSPRVRYGSYLVPRPAGSDVEHARYHHDDLAVPNLDEVVVIDELIAATRTLVRTPRGRHVVDRDWLLERRRRLQDALRRLPEM
jgi:hypothetical protein